MLSGVIIASPMYSLIYVSVATNPISAADLMDLLERARRNNAKASVTGMLLYKGGNFLQVLEGEERVVQALPMKISRDMRHHKMVTLLEGPLTEREFSEWTMGFSNLDAPEASQADGYSEFMNTPLTAEEFSQSPTRAQRLLRSFKRT